MAYDQSYGSYYGSTTQTWGTGYQPAGPMLATQGVQGGMYELHHPLNQGSRASEEYTQMLQFPPSDTYIVPGFVLNYYILVYFVGLVLNRFTGFGFEIHSYLGWGFLLIELGVMAGLALLPFLLPIILIVGGLFATGNL